MAAPARGGRIGGHENAYKRITILIRHSRESGCEGMAEPAVDVLPLSHALEWERGTHRAAMGGEGISSTDHADPHLPAAAPQAPPSPAPKCGRGEKVTVPTDAKSAFTEGEY